MDHIQKTVHQYPQPTMKNCTLLVLCMVFYHLCHAQIIDNDFDDHGGELYYYEDGKHFINIFSITGHRTYYYDTCQFLAPPRFTMELPGRPTLSPWGFPALHFVARFDSLQKAILYQTLATRKSSLKVLQDSVIPSFRNTDTVISMDIKQYLSTLQYRQFWEYYIPEIDTAFLFGPWMSDLKKGQLNWNVHIVVFAEMFFAFFNFEKDEVEQTIASIKLYRCPFCFEPGVRTTLPFEFHGAVTVYRDSTLQEELMTVQNKNRHVGFRILAKNATAYLVDVSWFENDNNICKGWIDRNTPLIIARYPIRIQSYTIHDSPIDNSPKKELSPMKDDDLFYMKDYLINDKKIWVYGYCIDRNNNIHWGWVEY